MPIYAYKCESCGFTQDLLQKLSDAPLFQCPTCGADSFKKQLTAAGFQLKGSGWYATDFKGGNNGAPSAPDGKPASDGDAKTETKPDAKGDGKGDGKADFKPVDGGAVAKKPDATPAAGSGA